MVCNSKSSFDRFHNTSTMVGMHFIFLILRRVSGSVPPSSKRIQYTMYRLALSHSPYRQYYFWDTLLLENGIQVLHGM